MNASGNLTSLTFDDDDVDDDVHLFNLFFLLLFDIMHHLLPLITTLPPLYESVMGFKSWICWK